MVILSGYFCLYYNMLLSYTLYYMISSFKNPLPWVGCDNSWNTDECFDNSNKTDSETMTTAASTSGYSATEMMSNFSMVTEIIPKRVRASEEYWK